MLEFRVNSLRRCAWEAGALLVALCVAPTGSRAQAGVEAAGADSASAGVTTAVTKALPTSLPHPGTDSKFAYVRPLAGLSPDETNRKALEQRAGDHPTKLLLQSVPGDAMIFIDGMFVGCTPLLLNAPAGKIKVEMRGKREEFGERLIDLPPNETQQLTLTLTPRYPTSITIPAGHVATPPGVTTAGVQVLPDPSLPHPGKESNPASLPARQGPSPDEANRKALEQQAGKDAAKLVLQSVPSGAMTYLDGTFVGRTPLQLIVAPGKYKVEMRGNLEEFGERLVGLLPSETQQLTLELAVRYPAKISAR
jgi:hypothetical protein